MRGQPSSRTGAAALLAAAVITAALLMAGGFLIRSFVTGSDASAIPGVSFDSVINKTTDALLGLIPSGFSDDGRGPVQAIALTPSPSVAPSPSPTPEPSIDPASVKGSPLSLQSLTSAWQSNGMTASVHAADPADYSGFEQMPVRITLSKAGNTIELAAFLYDGRDAIKGDWNTPAGERPSPKSGRTLPQHTSIWWNQNAVVVVLTDGALTSDAREAFFDIHS